MKKPWARLLLQRIEIYTAAIDVDVQKPDDSMKLNFIEFCKSTVKFKNTLKFKALRRDLHLNMDFVTGGVQSHDVNNTRNMAEVLLQNTEKGSWTIRKTSIVRDTNLVTVRCISYMELDNDIPVVKHILVTYCHGYGYYIITGSRDQILPNRVPSNIPLPNSSSPTFGSFLDLLVGLESASFIQLDKHIRS